jgi:hypothetical protein
VSYRAHVLEGGNLYVQVVFLLVSGQLEFYTIFVGKYPDFPCSLSSFENLKPWWMRRLRVWNTCCCRYHQELTKLMIAINGMRTDKKGVHSDCSCDYTVVCGGIDCGLSSQICNAHREIFERLMNQWTSILCEKGELSMWHKCSCLLGECVECGVNLLRVCPSEMSSEKLVKWKSIGYKVVGTTEEGNQRKALTLEYQETTPRELI